MMSQPFSPDRETFAGWVHDALNRLYDSPYLEAHPLADLLVRGEDAGTGLRRSQQLRQALLKAIQGLRPAPGTPAQSPDWRAYRILEARYIEGLSPNEVMELLGLARSQYFRDQARVLSTLTDLLWEQWQESRAALELEDMGKTREDLARAEAERLCAEATWEEVNVTELLRELEAVVAPLAHASQVSLRLLLSEPLSFPNADRVMLRQAVLNLLTCGVDVAQGGHVEVRAFVEEGWRGVHITAWGRGLRRRLGELQERHRLGLEASARLIESLGGKLELHQGGDDCWEARLLWPTERPRILLVVDDNEGFVALFRRYLAGHKWQVVGAGGGAEARKAIAETRPTVIVLDVMMPREDGWELLMALKADGMTREIPVVVCSVLNEPQLALSLGAAAYLAKPVTQQALLHVLSRWGRPGATRGPGR